MRHRGRHVQRMDKRLSGKGQPARVDPYEALRAEIARRHPKFSDRLKVIAEFALEHPTEMALGTVAEVATRAKVQPSAVVRFAHALGYGGFSDIQQVFRSRLVATVAPTYKERIARMEEGGQQSYKLGPEAVVAKLVHALDSSRPKFRYYVTLPTYAVALLRRVLPARALDAVARRN